MNNENKQKIETKSLKQNAALNVTRTLMSLIFPLVTFPYVSRVLGPGGTGKVHYAQSIVSYFSMIAMLGINTYGLREAAKIRDNKDKLSKFYKEIMAINLSSTVFAYILFFAALVLFKNLSEYKNLLLVTSASILFTTLGVEWLYGAVEDYTYITIRSIAFQFIGVVLLFVLVKDSGDVLQYASLSVITNVGSNILNFFHCKKYIYVFKKYSLEIKKHLKPIFILFGTTVAISIYTVLDTTMLGTICGDEQVGLYNAATKINKIVMTLIVSVGTVVTPRASNIIETDKVYFENLLKKTCNFFLILSIPCTAGLCFLAKPIILLFCGEQFSSAVSTMQIMTPIVIIISFGCFFTNLIFTPIRKDKFSLFSVLAGALVNFTLNSILIPKFYVFGAGIATVVAEFVVTSTKFFLAKKLSINMKALFKNFYQYLIAVIAMIFVLFVISFLKINIVANLVLSILLGIFSYTAILLLFRNEYMLNFIALVKRRFINVRS